MSFTDTPVNDTPEDDLAPDETPAETPEETREHLDAEEKRQAAAVERQADLSAKAKDKSRFGHRLGEDGSTPDYVRPTHHTVNEGAIVPNNDVGK